VDDCCAVAAPVDLAPVNVTLLVYRESVPVDVEDAARDAKGCAFTAVVAVPGRAPPGLPALAMVAWMLADVCEDAAVMSPL
jgi:hypothetical protein